MQHQCCFAWGVSASGYGASVRSAGQHLQAGVVREVAVDVAGCSCCRVVVHGSCRRTNPSGRAKYPAGNADLKVKLALDQLQGNVAAVMHT